jgi:hypothetical protein
VPFVSDQPTETLREQVWSKASPSALIAAIVGAAVTVLVDSLHVAVLPALAIVSLALVWLLFERRPLRIAASAVLVLVAVGTVAYWGYDWSQQAAREAEGRAGAAEKRLHNEERLVTSVSAGQDLSGFRAKLGPPTTKRTSGAYLIFQWQRPRETLQAVVKSDVVVSYAVYAKTRNFHPKFNVAGSTLNATPVSGGPGDALAANAYCGAHKAGYFEKSGGYEAVEARDIVLGAWTGGRTVIDVSAVCSALGGPLSRCMFVNLGNEVTPKMLSCIRSAPAGRKLRANLKASVYIETAPSVPLRPVMLYPPDEAAVL